MTLILGYRERHFHSSVIEFESARELSINFNSTFAKSMNLNILFAKSMNLNVLLNIR